MGVDWDLLLERIRELKEEIRRSPPTPISGEGKGEENGKPRFFEGATHSALGGEECMALVEGEVLGEASAPAPAPEPVDEWKIIDTRSGEIKTLDHEPTRDDLKEFKDELGYSAIKITRIDEEAKEVEVTPVDVSG